MTEEKLRELPRYQDSRAFSDLEKIVLAYADAMSATPVEVSDELFAKLRSQLDPASLVELTSAIAWENYRARFDHAFGIEAEGFSEGAFCIVPMKATPRA
ncbi:MAG: hypothetical protein U0166_21920 [Acidobacteriota bacterium]